MDYTVRIHYRKENPFLAHLEVMRAMERALRRAGLPLKYSKGFRPRPKMKPVSAPLPVGVSSAVELLDVVLTELVAADEFLKIKLPQGLSIISAKNIGDSQQVKVNSYLYRIFIKAENKSELQKAIRELLNREEILVVRGISKRLVNIRPSILSLEIVKLEDGEACPVRDAVSNVASLKLLISHQYNGIAKPKDVIEELSKMIKRLKILKIERCAVNFSCAQ